jgi:hypothetical protein
VSDLELRNLHPPRRCGDGRCCGGTTIEAKLGEVAIPQSAFGVFLPGAVYECQPCEWKRVEPLRDMTPKLNGWTASISPCRRANDVQPR